MAEYIVGFDCATDEKLCGLALTRSEGQTLVVEEVLACSAKRRPANVIASWMRSLPQAMLAIDAPLGWPNALRRSLPKHRAGSLLEEPADQLFRRETDRFIKRVLKKQSLDVGADRIARTAFSALSVLNELRALTSYELPLAWDWRQRPAFSVIEVYPAATLRAHHLLDGGYKKGAQIAQRRAIAQGLQGMGIRLMDWSSPFKSADALDAIVCALAGWDFVRGSALPPENQSTAEQEGWIWVNGRGDHQLQTAKHDS